jgi:hypothetical protein
MVYCDKCRAHVPSRTIRGCNSDNTFGPFCIDLCPMCYNEFRKMLIKWTNNQCWAEHDQHRHNNENIKVDLK